MLNTSCPNSKEQTVVVACFESKDTRSNLEFGLEKIRDSIMKLNDSKWRDKKIVLTLFGDYQFLCNFYGISGACGKYPCLWCYVSKEQIQIEENSISCDLRSLRSLERDFEQFKKTGKNLKNAKNCFNVIHQPVLPIEIDMVCPPYLHILLGIVKRHHDLLMIEIAKIDEEIGKYFAKKGLVYGKNKQFLAFIESYSNYLELLSEQKQITSELEKAMSKKCVKKAKTLKLKYGELQDKINDTKAALKLGVNQGPISNTIDGVLQKNRIVVQSYHSRSFTGNHCHKYLDLKVNQEICKHVFVECKNILSPYENGAQKVDLILEKAENISEIFHKLNSKFAKVHNSVSHCLPLGEAETDEIEQYIKDYLAFYRETFEFQIIPKQHFLEIHVLQWIRRWQTGLGLHGEQGCESSHAVFNGLKHSMRAVHHPLTNLKCTMREHHVRTSSAISISLPKPKRRKLFE